MVRKKLTTRQWIWLTAGVAVGFVCVAAASLFATRQKKPCYDAALRAAEQMQACMAVIREEKQARGIPLAPEDLFETGLMGEAYNFITTTLGDAEAKRTTTDPDMAALAVSLLTEAGLRPGDAVGCGFSGSFPALNIAVLCACDALDITPVYITSCGASTYGANNPGFSFPEMAYLLWERGLISAPAALVTPGGGRDMGEVADPELFAEIWARAKALGWPVLEEPDQARNVAYKKALLDEAGIDCFVAVGGNISVLGGNMITDRVGQGLLTPTPIRLNAKSGLLEYYLQEKTPCILLLNIKKLTADEGMPFDPEQRQTPGTGNIYYEQRYFAPALWVGLAAELCLLALFAAEEKRYGKNR